MALNWINPEDYSFNSLLLLERFQLRIMMDTIGRHSGNVQWKHSMGIALKANPTVTWYLTHRCPEFEQTAMELIANAPPVRDAAGIRNAELHVLSSVEDFIIYTTPEAMADRCDFIRGWDEARLFQLADLTGKIVLDVGAGSGRLAFAAAKKAAWVYVSEPVGTLREFMRDKVAKESIRNVRILDGLITGLPLPDSTFDIVMSGHVMGDDWDHELAELTRVCKPGGWLLNCPGDSERDMKPSKELVSRGWEELHYIGSFHKDVYMHRKQVDK